MSRADAAGAASFDYSGRLVVVTGARRGIGLAIATAFQQTGAGLVLLQRGDADPTLVTRAAERGLPLHVVPVELEDRASIAAAIEAVAAIGRPDVLVNNAGVQMWADSVEFPLDDFDRILDVNLGAVFQLCQGIGRGMVERGHGKIVNLASMTSFIGGFRAPAYAASKGAVAQLTKALCNEWAQHGVNVNAVAPGYLKTEMNQTLVDDPARSAEIMTRIPAKAWGDPRAIADATLFLASDAADYIHGIVLPVDGGWLAR